MSILKYNIPFEIDSPERTIYHRQLILDKPFLRKIYMTWYQEFIMSIPNLPSGILLELGSGGGFLKELIPNVICSDIIPLPTNDMTFSALEMPFEDNSVSGIFMVDTFHHIPDSELFLKEAKRVLKKGGKIIMIEPANSVWGRFIYKRFHHEPFIPEGGWTIPSTGPMSGANGALPWIVFERDKKLFSEKFPDLMIENIKYHQPLMYLISGGVSHRQLMPNFAYGACAMFDKVLSSLTKQVSMFMTIKIIKQ